MKQLEFISCKQCGAFFPENGLEFCLQCLEDQQVFTADPYEGEEHSGG